MANIETRMQGTSTNTKSIFRAPQFECADATIVYNESYFDGQAVRGTNEGQMLMETDWIAGGSTLNGKCVS